MVITSEVSDKPRIISEVKKNCKSKMKLMGTTSLLDINKPNIAGEVLWSVTPSEWHLRMAEVRQGSLYLYKHGSRGIEFRLPLRHLNLQPCSTPRTFRLSEGQGIPLATFQALTEEDYERWVRTLAVELLRQTPLQDIRFLDIIGITRRRERERSALRRGRSEECINTHLHHIEPFEHNVTWVQESEVEFVRCGRYRSYTNDTMPADIPVDRKNRVLRNKYNFKEDHKRRSGKHEPIVQDMDMTKIKIRRAHRGRPKIPPEENWTLQEAPRITWGRAQSMDDLKNMEEMPRKTSCNCKDTRVAPVISDESGISSGDENNNVSDNSSKQLKPENFTFVSVREKKKFFESLSSDEKPKMAHTRYLTRSSSIGDVHNEIEAESLTLRRRKRAKSLHDLDRHKVPVREMCRMFEHAEETTGEAEPTSPHGEEQPEEAEQQDKNATTLLNQRRLQRGERKLTKLRIQIAEVEDTIKIIADDLHSIGRNTLKRHEGLEIYAALQRRLQEENSRLERLQEETIRVIKDNQRIIAKLEKCSKC